MTTEDSTAASDRVDRHPAATSCFDYITSLVVLVGVPEGIPVIALLVTDMTAVSLRVVHRSASRNPIRLRFLDVAPVGRNQPIVGVDDTESGREAANHSPWSVWPTSFLVDALHENIIIWGSLQELQNDLVRPFPYVVGEKLVSGGTLLVRLNGDAVIELLPELE